jgi:hypothetical protein
MYGTDQYGAPEAVELLERLLIAGLSKWEPDPLAALAEVEATPPPAARKRPRARRGQ